METILKKWTDEFTTAVRNFKSSFQQEDSSEKTPTGDVKITTQCFAHLMEKTDAFYTFLLRREVSREMIEKAQSIFYARCICIISDETRCYTRVSGSQQETKLQKKEDKTLFHISAFRLHAWTFYQHKQVQFRPSATPSSCSCKISRNSSNS